jgi:hypothetical protein
VQNIIVPELLVDIIMSSIPQVAITVTGLLSANGSEGRLLSHESENWSPWIKSSDTGS